jgi:hypothetical protein
MVRGPDDDVFGVRPTDAAVDLHPRRGHAKLVESQPPVDTVGVAGGEYEALDSGRRHVLDDRAHQPGSDAASPVSRLYDDVRDPAKRGEVRDGTGKRDLIRAGEDALGLRARN